MALSTIGTNALAANAVTSAKITDGTIATANIADDAVTSAKILDGTIATGNIADDAVTGAKIEDSPSIANGLTLSDGNVVFAAGHGLDFSANTGVSGMTSELLDSYEEGTWTPTLRGESGTEPAQGSTTSAVYVKIGQMVHFEARMNLTTDNGGTGMEMTGLPFITTNAVMFHFAETAQYGVIGVLFSNGQIAAGSGHVTFREGNGSGAWQTGTYVQRGSGQYTVVGTYRTTS